MTSFRGSTPFIFLSEKQLMAADILLVDHYLYMILIESMHSTSWRNYCSAREIYQILHAKKTDRDFNDLDCVRMETETT